MPTFFIDPDTITPPTVRITGPLLHHLRGSLRLQQGEHLTLTVNPDRRYYVEVADITSREIVTHIVRQETAPPRTTPRIVLGQSLLKGDRMEWVLQKSTELGVDTIVPLESQHCVIKPKPERTEHQLARWHRIVLEAAQQSERWTVPAVTEPTAFAQFCVQWVDASAKGILAERSSGTSISNFPLPNGPNSMVILLVGPEGGWTQEEQELAQQQEFTLLTLGPRILRTETATVAGLSILQSRLGQLG
jgi:16S rRNA (uracil1498-N3)-methyltransferase